MTDIITNKGPLGYVWMASTYDRKLTRNQLLNTDLVQYSNLISHYRIGGNNSNNSAETTPDTTITTTTTNNNKSITLRYSAQLLYGVSKIYNRKTKYLLEDSNETLTKLKHSLYASGAISENANSVNVDPHKTIVSDLKSLMLEDQVTKFDLLYQEDLNLDEQDSDDQSAQTIFQQLAARQLANPNESTFDDSIEYGRNSPLIGDRQDESNISDLEMADNEAEEAEDDEDLELNFESNDMADRSIEIGRDAPRSPLAALENDDTSIIAGLKEREFDFGGFDQPLQTLSGIEDNDFPASTSDNEQQLDDFGRPISAAVVLPPASNRQSTNTKRRRTGITEQGEIILNNRKLVVDDIDQLEGIPFNALRENQARIMHSTRFLTLELSETQKLQLIYELSAPPSKKRKLWDVDSELQDACIKLAQQEEKQMRQQHELQFRSFDDFNDFGDFGGADLSLPELDSDISRDSDSDSELHLLYGKQTDRENSIIDIEETNAQSSIQIAEQLREIFKDNQETNLTQLIALDNQIHAINPERFPLWQSKNLNSELIPPPNNTRREAVRCLFEVLVLATNDCVSIEQDNEAYKLQKDFIIKPKDTLYSKFL